ncbi:phage holin, LLH family [Limosilactobacillus fermentum]|uniref:phage holin, LLH family n=1 Tax=Limosilactobacillus fermentum TaxID=1613 RepID=UPI0022441A32|nr:phage holin, LLH family [Limosilactobacillus fermentum]UZM84674.1 phage holin family protein [Limosilactobacillus fermentum]
MKAINEIVEWLIQSGALTALFLFAWKIVKPWLDAKASHASAEQSNAVWTLIDQVASTAVNSLVSNNKLTGEQKFNQAVQAVINALNRQGYAITEDTAKLAVQSAYEQSPLTGSEQTTSTVMVGPAGVTTTIKPTDGTVTAIDPKEV